MKKSFCLVLFFVLLVSVAGAVSKEEKAAFQTIQQELENVKNGTSAFVKNLGKFSDFESDFLKVLEKYPQLGQPKTVFLNEAPAKILIPLNLDDQTVGGFFQVATNGTQIISWLPWDETLTPAFKVSRKLWESNRLANEFPEIAELIPLKATYSPGTPVELSDLDEYFLIDNTEYIPSKTQEERKAYTDSVGLKEYLGRRTGSSKCLSYAASMASDWWKTILGLKLEKYTSFVNGIMEYGMNPRLVESYYYAIDASPYTFKKFTGKDRVTGEEIAYSPKHFSYMMSCVPLPPKVNDPLKKEITYTLPQSLYAMDQPFFNVFNHSEGKVDEIREALKRYGIIYAQHTVRVLGDRDSLRAVGMHAVNIVGTAKLKGQEMVLYYETFGKNHRDYLEDSFYGPKLRAFPVKFFYQGNVFPHKIYLTTKIENGNMIINFRDYLNRPIVPDSISVVLDNSIVPVKLVSDIQIPISSTMHTVKLSFMKKYFYAPEENGPYEREFHVFDGKIVEVKEYEKVYASMQKAKPDWIQRLVRKPSSYYDYLVKREEDLRISLVKDFKDCQKESKLLAVIKDIFNKNTFLQHSQLYNDFTAVEKFSLNQN
ncbi:MAG: hypothetical protein HQM08_14450 [Candidatus Riflebacteria bacterium]|nr:hypothetical protein [Candidatus Riflebacteria bacterium]